MDRRGSSLLGDGPDSVASPIGPDDWTPEQAWAALPVVLDLLAATPWWQLDERDVKARIRLLGTAENRMAATQVAALSDATTRGLPIGTGHRSGGSWLRSLVPLTPHGAAQRATLADDLRRADLTPTHDTFTRGEIGVGQAAAITRTMTRLDAIPDVDRVTWSEAQTLLLSEARRFDAHQLGKLGARLRNRLDPDAADRLAKDEDAQYAARHATLTHEGSGMWWLTASLPAKDGAMVATALDALSQPRPLSPDGTVDPRTGAQRRADALTGLAELSLAQRQGQPNGLPSRHGTPVRMVVSADIATLLADPTRNHGGAGVPPAIVETGEPGGWDVSPLEAQTLFCDAELVPAVLDADGRALDVGESQYRFPTRIRRAIELRDQHCSYPGCTAPPAWCHTHHLVPFGRNGRPGGPTSEANGTLLCGRHHRHVHATGWTGELVDGHVTWTPPQPGAPPAEPNDHVRQFETKLRQLALRWLARNPSTGCGAG